MNKIELPVRVEIYIDKTSNWLDANDNEIGLHEIAQALNQQGDKCKWERSFDGHFNIGCVKQTGERANCQFKRDSTHKNARWDFKYCPYCGKEIEL